MYANDKIDRLEGTTGKEKGGLIITKKGPAAGVEPVEFKKPEMPPARSILGLDRLAAAKRFEKEESDALSEGATFKDHHRKDSNFSAPKDR